MSDEAPAPPAPAAPPAAPPAADPPRSEERNPIPYERFQEVVAERRVWEQRTKELETRLKGLGSLESDLAKVRTDLEAERLARQTEAASWAEERALLGVGFTDAEAQDAARYAWSKLPEDKRHKDGIGAWLGEIKADPTKAPKILTPFIAQPPTQPPSPRPGAGQNPPPAGNVDAAALRAAREQAQRTGDWSTWDKLLKGA